jgi:hypothetical protein
VTEFTVKTETIEVDLIDDPGVEVRPDLLSAIRALGFLINPLYLQPKGDRYVVLWGKHRTACLRRLREPGRHGRDRWETVEAVIDRRRATTEIKDVRAMAVLIENHVRATNPGAEIDAVAQLARRQRPEQIARGTGLNLRVVKDLIRMGKKLHPTALDALRVGNLSLSGGKALLKLPSEEQEKVISGADGKIRVRDVSAAVRSRQTSLLSRLDGPGPMYSNLTDLANQLDAVVGQFAGDDRRTLINAAEILRRKEQT